MKPAPAPPSAPLPGWSLEGVLPYLWVLVLAVLLALGLRLRIFEDYLLIAHRADPVLDGIRTVLRTSFWIQFVLFWWVALRWLPLLPRRQPLRQRTLLLAALLATGMSLVNLLSESLAIYRLKLASYDLLFESSLLYGAITLNFLFWYWLIDHPPRNPCGLWEISRPQAGSGVSMPYGIVFPEEALERNLLKSENWSPGFTDYLYFTILSSNCFGAPEGHSLVGAPIKRLHMLHSMVMLAVVIVILARAINTLG